MDRLTVCSLLCSLCALALLLTATVTDFWISYSKRSVSLSVNQGLWRLCLNRKCQGHKLGAGLWNGAGYVLISSMLLTVVGMFLGLLSITDSQRPPRRWKGRGCALAFLSAGLLSLFAAAGYTLLTHRFLDNQYVTWRFGWSFTLVWISISLLFIAGFIQILSCKHRERAVTNSCQN